MSDSNLPCPVVTGEDARVMAWTDPARRRDEGQPLVLTPRAVHTLPGRVPSPRRTATRHAPTGFGAVLVTTLAAGSPWGYDLIRQLSVALPRADGPAGIVTTVLDTMLLGLSWLHWGGLGDSELFSGHRLARTIQVALFLLIVLVLLRRLAAGGAPSSAYRFLGHLGAAVVAAALATIGGAVVHLAIGSGGYLGSGIPMDLRNELARALLCGVVIGLLLAVASTRRPRSRPTVPGLGGN
jgi:hypothetical protein